jgi:hypothetical protein
MARKLQIAARINTVMRDPVDREVVSPQETSWPTTQPIDGRAMRLHVLRLSWFFLSGWP